MSTATIASPENYKLVYFDARGLAEPIRWIFAYAGVPFEDARIHHDDWSEHVNGYSWGQLPVLFENGLEFTQSGSIARYLSRKFKLEGHTPYETHLCDQYVDHIFDFLKAFSPWYMTVNKVEREAKRADMRQNLVPKFIANFERVNKHRPGKYLLGNHVSYADFYLASFMDVLEAEQFLGPRVLDGFPEVRQHKLDVFAIPAIKELVAKNPNALPCCGQCQRIVQANP